MFNLGADARLDSFDLVGEGVKWVRQIQRLAFAWAHGHMPVHITLGLWPFVCTPVARIGKGICLLAVQQLVRLGHVIDVGSRTSTLCTKPESASTPMCAFMPKYHWLPFLV